MKNTGEVLSMDFFLSLGGMDNEDCIAILDSFKSEFKEVIGALESNLGKSSEEVQRLVHGLKGTSAMIGFSMLANHFIQVEQMLKSGSGISSLDINVAKNIFELSLKELDKSR